MELTRNDARISIAKIAEELGISRRVVIKQTNSLQETVRLSGEKMSGRFNLLRIQLLDIEQGISGLASPATNPKYSDNE